MLGRANSRSRLSAGWGTGALADSAGALFTYGVMGRSGRANSRSRLSAGRGTGALADSARALFAPRGSGLGARVGRANVLIHQHLLSSCARTATGLPPRPCPARPRGPARAVHGVPDAQASQGVPMPREIRLNAFEMNCVGHQSPGLWAHPRDRSSQYKDLEYWTDLARLLERGRFDGLFIADVLGIYDVLDGNGDAAIRQAAQVPVNDPLALITPMAAVTRHLGFGLTASLSFEHPYPFARRLSTLDHLTKGRIGWNVVTSYLKAARATSASRPSSTTTAATTMPTNTYRCSTSSSKAVGRTARCSATVAEGSSATRARFTRSAMSASTSRYPASISANRRRAAHAGALPGRRVESWQALRRRARRVRVRRRAIEDRAQAGGRRHPPARRRGRPRSRARYWCSTCRRWCWAKPTPRPGPSSTNTAPSSATKGPWR